MLKEYAVYLGLGFELAGLIVVFLFIGREVDKYFNMPGIGIAMGALLAMATWIYHLVLIMKKAEQSSDKEK